jgi:MFS family permease
VTTGSYALAAAANAVWWTCLILFEVPTGYVGDRIGRRRALLLGTVIRVVTMGSMAFVGSFREVVVVFVVWAFASTLRSGTVDAWLYEVLGQRLDELLRPAAQHRTRPLAGPPRVDVRRVHRAHGRR